MAQKRPRTFRVGAGGQVGQKATVVQEPGLPSGDVQSRWAPSPVPRGARQVGGGGGTRGSRDPENVCLALGTPRSEAGWGLGSSLPRPPPSRGPHAHPPPRPLELTFLLGWGQVRRGEVQKNVVPHVPVQQPRDLAMEAVPEVVVLELEVHFGAGAGQSGAAWARWGARCSLGRVLKYALCEGTGRKRPRCAQPARRPPAAPWHLGAQSRDPRTSISLLRSGTELLLNSKGAVIPPLGRRATFWKF
jgi:hypothetical protein